jgi:hypothetical protein
MVDRAGKGIVARFGSAATFVTMRELPWWISALLLATVVAVGYRGCGWEKQAKADQERAKEMGAQHVRDSIALSRSRNEAFRWMTVADTIREKLEALDSSTPSLEELLKQGEDEMRDARMDAVRDTLLQRPD